MVITEIQHIGFINVNTQSGLEIDGHYSDPKYRFLRMEIESVLYLINFNFLPIVQLVVKSNVQINVQEEVIK